MKIIEYITCGAGTSLPQRKDLWPNKVEFLMDSGEIYTVDAGLGPGYWNRIRIELEKIVGKTSIEDWPISIQLCFF